MKVENLQKISKKLVDEIILNPEQMENIIKLQLASRNGFRQYTLRNCLLASKQMYMRKGETCELLAPYKKWGDVERNVKYGEKALYILAPIQKKIEEATEEKEAKYITWFKRVPVFDLSQTEGKPLELDLIEYDGTISLKNIINRCNVKVNKSQKEITRGYTDGKEIWISEKISEKQKICTYFHELAHYLLHYNNCNYKNDTQTKEIEAESVSYMVSKYLGIENKESKAYIYNYSKNRDIDDIVNGTGNRVLNTVTKIINDLKLSDLVLNDGGVS